MNSAPARCSAADTAQNCGEPSCIPFPCQLKPEFSAFSERSREFYSRFFPGSSESDWNSWKWQLQNRFKTASDLERFLNLAPFEKEALARKRDSLPIGITPYYASIIDRDDPLSAIRKTVVPWIDEFHSDPREARDPLAEDGHSPVPGLVHRYPDRVLFLVSAFCSVYCRYCTRSRVVGNFQEYKFNRAQWEKALEYIENTPAVRDVLLSGGDPLDLSDEHLEYLLTRLRAIKHVEFIRIGTKAPIVLPQRVTRTLARMLKKFHPLWMSIHLTHPSEITEEVKEACERLADAGLPLGSQTVLLKGVNDDPEIMKELMHKLLMIRVRPYYLYQCDPITGSAHFRTPISKGLEIIQALRGHTTGYAVPTYVIDAPGGGGKIPLQPEYVVGREGNELILKNFNGEIYRYPDI